MYKQEQIKPYGQEGEKGQQVESMFNAIAASYDTLNHRLSWNIDKGWRRKAVEQLRPYAPHTILDIATGTGDFAILLAQQLQPETIVGTDISEGMMDVARKKVAKAAKEDCMQLSYDDNSFDAVTAAFAIRNFASLDTGLKEMHRVLKTNGHLSIIELTTPVHFPMKQLFAIYAHTVLPIYGRLISKDKRAYQYLTDTIEAFPQGETMMTIFKKAGFKEVRFKRLTMGICTMYFATK